MTYRPLLAAASMLAAAMLIAVPAQASAALTHGAVHLLSGPASTFGLVADVPGHSQVGVLWCGPANFDWCLVYFHKKRGWVHGGDLSPLGDKATPADAKANGGAPTGQAAGGSGGGLEARAAQSRSDGDTGPNASSVGSAGTHAVGLGL